ncbi:hypothetical protein GCM10011581_15130 [Saccharopolyspora subtropica]|uniref:Uncharacterized protein n=1 Tax=Saccharopolyspora thermophila TaxID=89367 RepID=A0A917JNL6_9PSEU|nr:hypothetical protein [Saccharopolyspora subtropica]GGI78971.1 hypothetical protein GCM10011581_15130 [Saccharopolyspora subtropica]
MGAIVVAIVVGLVAVGLVVALVIFSTLALAGLKAVNAAHESRSWFVNRRRR